jgi:hypothetical protein
VHLEPVSNIGNNSDNMLAYVQNAYDTWDIPPIYLLIAGDHENVRSYSCFPNASDGSFLSDLPYTTLEGTDYWPDLTAGRLSVQTVESCQVVVDKILAYDRYPDTGSWYEHSLVAAYLQDKDEDCVAERWFMETAVHVYDFLNDQVGHTLHGAFTTDRIPCSSYTYLDVSYPHRPPHPDTVPS